MILIMSKLFNSNLSLIFWVFWRWKSYYTIKMALDAYLNWKIVISNTWLAFPHVRYYVPSDLPKILEEIHHIHQYEVVPSEAPLSYLLDHDIEYKKSKPIEYFVINDEAWIFFNNRNFKQNFDNPKMLEMLFQPRKYGLQICAICQDLNTIDVNFIRVAQEIVEFTIFLWFFRRAYSYDKKYINLDNQIWNPDTPIIAKKTWLHARELSIDNNKYFGWLYFTKEILWMSSFRSKNAILSISDYRKKYSGPTKDWNLAYTEKFKFLLKDKNIFTGTKYEKKAYPFLNNK